MSTIIEIALATWTVTGQMAPYLLFGFGLAGLLHLFISPKFVERHLGGRGFTPILKASLFGVPLPLCSCSVIPVTASMRQHGASRAATASFLLSTPQTGVDSIFATYALLGPVYAVFRPAVALVTGLLGGVLVALFGEKDETAAPAEATALPVDSPCCSSKKAPEPAACCATAKEPLPEPAAPCCSTTPPKPGWREKALDAIRYAYYTLPRDIARPLVIGLVLAGVITALATPGRFEAILGGGILSMLLMIAVGIPLYVCATASIPLAVGFIHLGASPGAALAFLIAGPATNAATVAVVAGILGRRGAALYLGTVAVMSVTGGLLLDLLYRWLPEQAISHAHHAHGAETAGPLASVWAIALLALLAIHLVPWKKFRRDSGAPACCASSKEGSHTR
jgi:uncharacterized protein